MIAYRPDIDGLRGIAVLAVVLFHAGLPGIPGGFVGVDIFFVISGYLITSIILAEHAEGRFSYLRFYERRARRILPALYTVIAVTLAACWHMQTPAEFVDSAQQAVAAVLFAANVYFWASTDYFSTAAEFKPLLHTWSLGVEEQFYLLFPAFAMLLAQRGLLVRLGLVLLLVSLAACVYTTATAEVAAFYLLPFRAWQLLCGALLAATPRFAEAWGPSVLNGLALCAALLLLLPLALFDEDTLFPGIAAAAPTCGAALAILVGLRRPRSWLPRLLAWAPLRGLGLISYSVYLWHWPVLAALRTWHASTELPLGSAGIGVVASLVLGYVSWRYVERPFRARTRVPRVRLWRLAAATSVVLLGGGLATVHSAGFPARLSSEARALLALEPDALRDDPCLLQHAADIEAGDVCLFDTSRPGAAPRVALWGDSHAGAMRGEFADLAMLHGVQGLFLGRIGCPPLPGILKTNFPGGEACLRYTDAALSLLLSLDSVELVVIHARWALSVEGARFGDEPGRPYILDDKRYAHGEPGDNPAHVARALRRAVHALQAAGKRVLLIGSVPESGYDVPRAAFASVMLGQPRSLRQPRTTFDRRQERSRLMLRAVAEEMRVDLLDPAEFFCDELYCVATRDGTALYIDDDHISPAGAAPIIEAVATRLELAPAGHAQARGRP